MHGFADLSRLRILDALRDGERRVVDLSEGLGLSRPNTSKHLACLHGCGLVERDPRGREVFYASPRGSLISWRASTSCSAASATASPAAS